MGIAARYALTLGATAALLAGCGGLQPASGAAGAMPESRTIRATSCPCLYVTNRNNGSVTVYPAGATGNVEPIQDIHGPKTGLTYPHAVAVDGRGNIYVANVAPNSVRVYAAGATGNAKPIESISGAKTQLHVPTGIALDPENGDIYVLNNRIDLAGNGSITVYAPGSNGDVAPVEVIQGLNTELNFPNTLALDPSGNIYVTNRGNYVTFYPAGSTGDAKPTRTIKGILTKMNLPTQLALDPGLNTYVVNFDGSGVRAYAAGANGNVAPIRSINGDKTKIGGPFGIALDAAGDIYVANAYSKRSREVSKGRITVYASDSHGNARPAAKIEGDRTGLDFPQGITVH